MIVKFLFIQHVLYLIFLGHLANCQKKAKPFNISVGLIYCNESDLIQATSIASELNEKQSAGMNTQIVIDIVGKLCNFLIFVPYETRPTLFEPGKISPLIGRDLPQNSRV